MPFESDAQRRLFHAARNDPQLRKKHGLDLATIEEFIKSDEEARESDQGPKQPKRQRKAKK